MKYKKVLTFDIKRTNHEEFNSGNYFNYINWEHHVDKGKYPCYNKLESVIYFDCKPDSKIRLTRSMANEMLLDEEVQTFLYQEIYDFLKKEKNDKPLGFAYPYPNHEQVELTIENSVDGNMIRFHIHAKHFNNREELIDAYIQKVKEKGIILS
ncbi:hypothetical protein CVD28_03470 [Bacillus sp. M6-12]|uniref:hypothetical protein n=1 Tax=Bacillus sp. M6-12 TaxID=2054166 RepID=UPI000C787FA5|nr:hypothetical protein [Bacillus sp. M6-12]PLS19489.1 hypothetical protein CVD28_03470 [Bacillus sp. M6-12]